MEQERIIILPIWAAMIVKNHGGNRIAQEAAQFHTKNLLIRGKSGATALWDGIKAGIRTSARCNQTLTAT